MTAADYEAWHREVERGLRDKKPFDSLVRKDEDSLRVEPLYAPPVVDAAIDAVGLGPIRASRSWLIGQSYQRPGVAAAAAEIARDAARGVEAFVIILDRATRLALSPSEPRAFDLVGKGGIAASLASDLSTLLDHVPIRDAHVFLDAGANGARTAKLAKECFEAGGVAAPDVAFMASIDPLGALAADGRLPRPMAAVLEEAHGIKALFPRGRALLVSGLPYHEAGATAALELGAVAATILEYLRAGFALTDIAVAMAADSEVLRGIAKARALRLIVAKLCRAAQVPVSQPFVLGVTSRRHQAVRDVETNIIRGTVETFALGVGGADAIVTRSFDAPLGGVDSRAKRVGRNTQLVLREEAQIGHGADPARGSYAAEALTLAIAEAGWNAMRAIEAEGGMTRSLLAGAIQARVARAHEERQAAIGKRKRVIVGVNEFAPKEHGVSSEWVRRDDERESERARLARAPGMGSGIEAAPVGGIPESAIRLDRVRDAERFEGLRAESDALAATGGRPSVLIVTLGARIDCQARVDFMTRLFEACGFDVAAWAMASATAPPIQPDVVVLASSDAKYGASGAEALAWLRTAFPTVFVVLAGKSGPLAEAVARVAPSSDFFVGMDVVAFVAGVLQRIRSLRTDFERAVRS